VRHNQGTDRCEQYAHIVGGSLKVLLISMNYWPEESGIGPYSTGLAEHLAEAGHRVTVLTAMPHYPQWRVSVEYAPRALTEIHNGVTVVRRRPYVPKHQSAATRLAYELSFLTAATPYAARARPDVVLGVVPGIADGVLSRLVAARAKAGYGVIFQDLMGYAAAQSGIPGGRTAAAAARRAERWVVARAAVVAPVSDSFVPYLLGLGVTQERMDWFPNWSHLQAATRNRSDVRQELGWQPTDWIVLHAGNLGLKQGLEQVVAAARIADSVNSRVRFVLMGDGSQRRAMERLADGVAAVSIRPFVDAAQLPDVLGAADVLLVSERPTVLDMSLPSKLTSYFAAGRPVVAAVHPDGATAREVTRAGAGLVSPAGEPRTLLELLVDLKRAPEEAEEMGRRGRAYARAHLGRDKAAARANDLVYRVARRTAAIRKVAQ
jgi:colanic acid biosynthesis glycosyl transferase WcaI